MAVAGLAESEPAPAVFGRKFRHNEDEKPKNTIGHNLVPFPSSTRPSEEVIESFGVGDVGVIFLYRADLSGV